MEDKMNKNKPFYLRGEFYPTALGFVLALVAVIVYAAGCASEFNGNAVSAAVVGWGSAAIIFGAIALGMAIAQYFVGEDSLVAKICSYKRFAAYLAFLFMILAFLFQILDEYSLLGTILYPIVSGTVGDPVDPTLSGCYFTSLIFSFIAMWCMLSGGLIEKIAHYRAEREKSAPETEVE